MRRMRIVPLTTVIALTACLTKETECPEGLKRTRNLCLEVGNSRSGDAGDRGSHDGGGSSVPTACYLDFDHDGAGSGDAVDCNAPVADLYDASAPGRDDADASANDAAVADGGTEPPIVAVVDRNDDCDDNDASRAPTLKETCDGIDNDCDDQVDENIKNACGGQCLRPLAHLPGETCSNGLFGVCLREDKYVCDGDNAVVCPAPMISGSTEVCDGKDNDCDGDADEADAIKPPKWYQDCDGDGYAASNTGVAESCAKPALVDGCQAWTAVAPVAGTTDCNDLNSAYRPGASFGYPSNSTSFDLNCDGVTEKENAIVYNEAQDGYLTLCAPGETENCGYWTDSSQARVSKQPNCSRDKSVVYPFHGQFCSILSCANFFADNGNQRCR